MHGRVKVRTTEEEIARKKKERQEKLKKFKYAMQKIQSKRSQGELDKELLELTGNVLSGNPDIYTLWNIRREIFTIFVKDDAMQEELSSMFDAELQLTEYCLKINPKSYGAWHQREWVLTTRSDPNWAQELAVCNKYLKFDERNFHTWDYRRFVVSKCKPPLKDEFDFTTEKLHDNFSNYSAWHYRSKMLVALYPDLEGGRPIEDSHHKHELKMVQSAAFTDPDDTSAWFYQRWLLGAVKNSKHLVVVTVTPSKATLAFNQHVSYDHVKEKINITFNKLPVTSNWLSCTENQYDNLWIFKHNETILDDMEIEVHYDGDDGKQTITCMRVIPNTFVGKKKISFQKNYSEPVIKELETQLDACRQLLALEPDNKWTLLTTTVFLYCIDAKLYHNEVIQNLQTLKSIDKLRDGYYNDLKTKWCIENQLYNDFENNSISLKISFDEKITSLPHLQYYSYCENVDLSDQNLSNKVLPSLVVLQNCKNLSLRNNKLTTLRGFPSLELEVLDLQNNDLDKTEVALLQEKLNCNIIF
ncbi:geranylgeranyl transferase type-2 subunit alpha [Ostrinia nubilalis]|uniref:geranylgeranyl transferase type-2 subunit alpha n=1 Tax=Ostrinia nubilalis TaxID=29057 RepID=UPI0030822D42